VGVHLPSTGTIMIQWHHYNNTGATAMDGTKVQICAVPEANRVHKAGLTFLGTETISVPAGSEGKNSGTCVNDSSEPITILGFTPHMHTIGIHMQSVVNRGGTGPDENVFDMPFQFDYQTNYMMNPPVVLMPGDTITSTCTWQNNGVGNVGFGQSTKQEMCYQFALSYPYGALNNGVLSLIGATNTCW
jgi:dopamine beta-monooxygenase